MAYTPPTIGSSGPVISSYNEIVAWLVAQYLSAYGSAVYLGPDSPDYQDISIRGLQNFDCSQVLQSVYNSLSPQTAIGVTLDLIPGRLIGTARNAASYSTATVTLTGTPGTVITNGVVRDINGSYWNLASPITIGDSGVVSTTATSQTLGTVTANPGDISVISTPTAGWTAVTNTAAASPGEPIESDAAYRARLAISQTKPSLTLRAGTAAAIAAVTNVTRSIVFENQYGYTCGFGICHTANSDSASPPNSNVVVLDLGPPFNASQVGQAIVINGVSYAISEYVSPTELTLTTAPGTQSGVSWYIGDGVALGPAHSITCVVEGGAQGDIAQAIYSNRGIGPYTNGSTAVSVTDPSNPAVTMTIRFFMLSYTPIYVTLNVHPLGGFTSTVQSSIQVAVVSYLNSLGIGQTAVWSQLFYAAGSVQPNIDTPLFSIHSLYLGTSASPTQTADIAVAFNAAASGTSAYVVINLV